MYSEQDDFKEKLNIISDMVSSIADLVGKRISDIAPNGTVLEIGGSGGVLGGLLTNQVGRVICTDVVDSQVQYGGEFPKLLKEKFERNNFKLDLAKIEFQLADAQNLHFRDNLFDLVFSQNAMEHIPSPLQAIEEAFRVLKPGGIFYATFDPIWTADSGSHFLHYVSEPWLHLLVSDDEFCSEMRKGGARDAELVSFRKDMNRLPASFYLRQIPLLLKQLSQRHQENIWSGCVNNAHEHHANRAKAAQKLECNSDELLVRGIRVVAVK